MPGRVPGTTSCGIAVRAGGCGRGGGGTWMPGTSPGMTTELSGECPSCPTLSPIRGRRPAPGASPSPPPVVTPDLIRGPGPQAPPSPGFPGPRIKSGVTAEGHGGLVRAGRNPRPDPAFHSYRTPSQKGARKVRDVPAQRRFVERPRGLYQLEFRMVRQPRLHRARGVVRPPAGIGPRHAGQVAHDPVGRHDIGTRESPDRHRRSIPR